METEAGERGRCPEVRADSQMTQEGDRQVGTWAGPEGQEKWASPALVKWGRSPWDSLSGGMG